MCVYALACAGADAQNTQKITATLEEDTGILNIQHEIRYYNASKDTLNSLYLLDWNAAYSHKNTALAKRFAEEFDRRLHLAKARDRGSTTLLSLSDKNYKYLSWERLQGGDILKVQLNFPVYPGQSYLLRLVYRVKLPNSEFTGYGRTETGNLHLRYWYISPALYADGGWRLYSNTNLDDRVDVPTDYEVAITYPPWYQLTSDLEVVEEKQAGAYKQTTLKGNGRGDVRLFLERICSFKKYPTYFGALITNLPAGDLPETGKIASVARVFGFIRKRLGAYPHATLLVSETDYKKNPLYGSNQLPSFLKLFPDDFQFELKLLKTALLFYLQHTLYIDVRREGWVVDALQTYLMIRYVEEYYPRMKLPGALSEVWLVRGFHLTQMGFNEQYSFLYMLMARKNLDQALTTSRDSLIKFNEKIANKYKAGLGLKYLDDYEGGHAVDSAIQQFYKERLLLPATATDFERLLKDRASKNIDWFFEEYVSTRHKIDYRIKKIAPVPGDSILVNLKNKRGTSVPMSLFGVKNDSVVLKYWFTGIEKETLIKIPRKGADRWALNYNKVIPEFNQQDNWKSLKKGLFADRPLQLRFFKDAENPFYHQVFYVPVFTYNLYDGFTAGLRVYNKSFIERPFLYDIRPSYAATEKTLVGGASFMYRHYIENKTLYLLNYSLHGNTFHYAQNLRYSTLTPSVYMGFRPFDFRSNERQFITLRNVNVFRDRNPEIITDPDYSVLDIRYQYSNNGIINYLSGFADFQLAGKFSKLSATVEYRRLFQNNWQLNLRFFGGAFLRNKTGSDFFSFALDRPTDYLFEYDYLGRSEESGIFSQQIIIAEGGFKSKLSPAFANNWMLTGNASINLWRWIEMYGDAGWAKNDHTVPQFVYDAGIRLNLVTDYFELYFPFYSNNGWEIAQPHYSQKIRFIVTLSPRTLTGLFTRKWF